MTRKREPVEEPVEAAVDAPLDVPFEPVPVSPTETDVPDALPLPTTGGAWLIDANGGLVLVDPPTKPAPLPGMKET